MKITSDIRLRDFKFWAGAKGMAAAFTGKQMDALEDLLEELYPEGLDEMTVNHMFWFEPDWLARLLGFKDYEDLEEHNKERGK